MRKESLVLVLCNHTRSGVEEWFDPNECFGLSLNSPFLPDVFSLCCMPFSPVISFQSSN